MNTAAGAGGITERTGWTGRTGRLVGLDAARAVALIGMLAVHFGPKTAPTLTGELYALPHGRASILFALVAGVGMALLSRTADKVPAARLRLVCMAAALLPLGLALQTLDHPVAVILHHYAAFFVFGALVIGLSRDTLLALAAVATALGPAVYFAGKMVAPELFDRATVDFSDGPFTVLLGIGVSGPYPLLTWSAPILWGIWLGRNDLAAPGAPLRLILGGLAVAALALLASNFAEIALGAIDPETPWLVFVGTAAHSQMPLWIVQAAGAASAVTGLMLLLGRLSPGLLAPLTALGQMVLTVYVAHLAALTLAPDLLRHDTVRPAVVSVAAFTLAATLFALVWRAYLGRGPVERLTHLPWDLLRNAGSGASRQPGARQPLSPNQISTSPRPATGSNLGP